MTEEERRFRCDNVRIVVVRHQGSDNLPYRQGGCQNILDHEPPADLQPTNREQDVARFAWKIKTSSMIESKPSSTAPSNSNEQFRIGLVNKEGANTLLR